MKTLSESHKRANVVVTVNTRRSMMRALCGLCLVSLLLPAFGVSAVSGATEQLGASAPEAIGWAELGAKATADYKGEGMGIERTGQGARLRCAMQDLEGEVTPEGLTLISTPDDGSRDQFRVRLSEIGRDGACVAVGPGRVDVESGLVRLTRAGVAEEYSVSADGVRQDFVVSERPVGIGELRVTLDVTGARTETAADGARLVLDDSGRRLAYSKLRVSDAAGNVLAARIVAEASNRLALLVDDGGAVYPIRIDPTYSDANWVSIAQVAGTDGTVYSAVIDSEGNLFIGGSFTVAGEIAASCIAKWDGSSWSALGSGMGGTVPTVGDLAFDSSGNLYAGGSFTTAGGVSVNYIAKWDGSSWSALGSGLSGGTLRALAFDSNGNLYAGGSFTMAGGGSANYIAKWDGSSWSALGSGMNSTVLALACDSSDNLYAGGSFTTAGGVSVKYVAKWDGSNWSALGSGMDGEPYSLAHDGSGNLYAGGLFFTAGGNSANYIARWDGSNWSALGSGMNHIVFALALDGSGNLYAGGNFSTAGGLSAQHVAKWDGSNWSALDSGISSPGQALTTDNSGNLYAGGSFVTAGATAAGSIAKWNGSAWSALGSGADVILAESVDAMATDADGNLYVDGIIHGVGTTFFRGVAKWNGTTWSTLSREMYGFTHVLATDSSGNLYAGGEFTAIGGVTINRIAMWNGVNWSGLGGGVGSGYPDRVRAIVIDDLGNMYVGGRFTTAGGVSANNIAKWDGASWSALGSGMDSVVDVLAFDSSGNLYAGGYFTTAGGGAANYIAKWDGSSWSALGGGMDSIVNALAFDSSDNLYAGGSFTTAGGVSANNIAKWDGSSWSALGSGVDRRVYALVLDGNGDLYAGGDFTTAGGENADYIAKWDGSVWSVLGSGVDGSVNALAVDGSGNLYAGGSFETAGGKVTVSVAKWATAPGEVLAEEPFDTAGDIRDWTLTDDQGGTATGALTAPGGFGNPASALQVDADTDGMPMPMTDRLTTSGGDGAGLLGDYTGKALSFDFTMNAEPALLDVIFTGNGTTWYYTIDTSSFSTGAWKPNIVPMVEDAGWFEMGMGGNFAADVAAVTEIGFQITYITMWSGQVYGFDNIRKFIPDSLPAAPIELSATALDAGSIKLDWTDNAYDEDEFVIERTRNSVLSAMNDESGQTRDAALKPTMGSGPAWVADGSGGLHRFDGTDDCADAGDVGAVEGLDTLTVSAWINPGSVASDAVLISKGNVALNTTWVLWQDSAASVSGRSRTISFGVSSGSALTRVESSTDAAPADTWTHVMAVWQRSPETVKLYINGVLDREDTSLQGVTMKSGTDPLRVGAGAGGAPFYDGDMTGVRIYSRAADAADAAALYAAGRQGDIDAIATTGLEVFYPCSGVWQEIDTVGANVETYTDTSVSAATHYEYRVRATNPAGDSENSNTAEAETPVSGAPTTPTGLSATALDANSIQLDWTHDATDEDGFKIERTQNSVSGAFSDTSGASRHAALKPNTSTGPAWAVDGSGGLYRFDGADDYADAGDVDEVEGIDALTVAMWIKPDSIASDTMLVSKGNVALNTVWALWQDESASISGRGRTISFGVSSGSALTRVEGSTAVAPAGEWTHVVAVWQRSPETVKLYINGALDQENTSLRGVTMKTSADPVRLGAGAGGGSLYDGDMTGVRIYSRAVSASDASDLYTAGRQGASDAIATTGLQMFYPCGGTWEQIDTAAAGAATYTDTTVSPDTSYQYRVKATNASGDSAYSNTDTEQTPGPAVPTAPSGLTAEALTVNSVKLDWTDNAGDETGFAIERRLSSASGALADGSGGSHDATANGPAWVADGSGGLHRFDGANDYADAGDVNAVEGLGALTVSVWIKPDSDDSDAVLVSKGNVAINTTWVLWQDADASISGRSRTISFGVSSGSGLTRVESSTGAAPADQWTHVVAVWQSSSETAKLYINGALDRQDTSLQGVTMNTSTDPLRLGAGAGGAPFYAGDMTGVRIYSRAVSASDASDLYTAGRQGAVDAIATTGLQVFYPCNGAWEQVDTVGAGIETYTDTTASPETSYQYRVKATNAEGSSDYSNTATAQTPGNGGDGSGMDEPVMDGETGEDAATGSASILPVEILTSGGQEPETNAWAMVDGDPSTVWTGASEAGGWWTVFGYAAPVRVSWVDVYLQPEWTADVRFLGSLDAEEWFDLQEAWEISDEASLTYLWIIFADDGSGLAPTVSEIDTDASP